MSFFATLNFQFVGIQGKNMEQTNQQYYFVPDLESGQMDARNKKLARFCKALSHPTRIAILRFLAGRSSCYFGAINEELPIAKATVSQHLKELKSAGLIQGEIEAPKVKYCINRANWALARHLLDEFFTVIEPKNEGGSCCSKE